MRKINLLDWRSELILQNQKETGIAAAVALAIGFSVWVLANRYFADQINSQNNKNAYITKEIKILDRQIKEVEELEATKARLISRMKIIDELQKSRPEVVRLFDDIARIVPDGTHFQTAKQAGTRINFTGVTESSTRVSALMREIMAADTLDSPDLVGKGITTSLKGRKRQSSFELSARQIPSQKSAGETVQ